ncbi:hypothetical protein METH_22080 (plasmid) [Leisingera methylohalidivorans DSM 14336]|uniref:Uncharacterized protein n=1 Tax=Leisingera methylohalidivorans DSM 14336 TaxID=999552 RepID=V9W0I6_9RHOB|nr:hypothetical protein METH_22080 [Leisingera methylohalidivorans DSM 14336]
MAEHTQMAGPRTAGAIHTRAATKNATGFPSYGQARSPNGFRKLGVFVSPSGVRPVWLRHGLANLKPRLKALVAEWPLALVVNPLQAMHGIALISALTFIAKLGDVRRLKHR